MTGEELIKAVTWAIHSTDGDSSAKARAAIRAVHEAMREVSEAMREPSDDMADAAIARVSLNDGVTIYHGIWRAMLAASPLREE